MGGDWGERGRGPFNRNRDPFYTQIMDLLLLAVDIQEEILHLEVAPGAQPISERALRYGLRSLMWEEQRRAWKELRRSMDASCRDRPG